MAIIRGTPFTDRLVGTAAADTIYAAAGDDLVRARAGNDAVFGNLEDDELWGELGNDRLFGEAGDDRLTGGLGNDTVNGGEGVDYLVDAVPGGPDGNDVYDGGAGVDAVSYYGVFGSPGANPGVRLTLGEAGVAAQARQGAEVDTVRNVEDVAGAWGSDDFIVGNSQANQIVGYGGDDHLEGRGGNDGLFLNEGLSRGTTGYADGGAGDDLIIGGHGTDRLLGGTGADTIVAGKDVIGDPAQRDFVDLGADGQRDLLRMNISHDSPPDGGEENYHGVGVERVGHFGSQDVLDLTILDSSGVTHKGGKFLDSSGDGVVSAGDTGVSQVGQNLVVDVTAAFGNTYDGQQIVFENLSGISVDHLL